VYKLQAQNITKRFDDNMVLDNIAFKIEKGDRFGIIGPNGAGKTTLFNIIIGLLKANSGQVLIDGKTIAENSVTYKSKIGYIPQDLALLEEITVSDNLEYFGVYYGLFGKKLKKRIHEVLDIVKLQGQEKQKVKKLSGGLKRRLNIGLALLHEPEILMMDEPTVGVDAQFRRYFFDYIKKLNLEKGVTLVYTSHYMEEVEQLCQKILILDAGKKISSGTKSEIKALINDQKMIRIKVDSVTNLMVPEIRLIEGVEDFILNDQENMTLLVNASFKLETLIQVCKQQKMNLVGIHFEEPTLEDVFLSLTGKRLGD